MPQSLISPVARGLFANPEIYPLPLFPGNTQNWTGAGRSKTNSDIGDVKIDYSLSTRDNLVVRFSIGETSDSKPLRLISTRTVGHDLAYLTYQPVRDA